MAYGDFRDLRRRTTAADKVLCDKAFNIPKNLIKKLLVD